MFKKLKTFLFISSLLAVFVPAPCTFAASASDTEALHTFIDDENVIFSLTSIEEDDLFGYTWSVYLENKTDKNLMFSLEDVSVNDVMCDPFWAANVTAGNKSNESISWINGFDEIGIEKVTKVEFRLKVYDDDDWSTDPLTNNVHIYYPEGEDAFEEYVREGQDTDTVLFDNDSASMTVIGFEPDDLFGYTVKTYLVNKTDKTLMFSTENATVNGFMCDPFWATTVAPGKVSYSDITWGTSSFEENGITEVEKIELPITIYDYDDFMSDNIVDETFTIEVQ